MKEAAKRSFVWTQLKHGPEWEQLAHAHEDLQLEVTKQCISACVRHGNVSLRNEAQNISLHETLFYREL